MENAADKFSWVDPLIGSIPHTELALRNKGGKTRE